MIQYYVLDTNGQKYGPADVPLLNKWIVEGRLTPDSMLQDATSGVQTRASMIPALKFGASQVVGGPPPAPATANPYDTPRPMGPASGPSLGPQPFSSANVPIHMRASKSLGGQIALAWGLTVLTPLVIYFSWLGLAFSIWGIRAGAALLSQGVRGQGIALIVINVIWIGLYVAKRVLMPTHYY